MRTTHNINECNKHLNLSKCTTVITFRNQQLLDLWLNEMQGQISDGMWENSRGTEWLWRDAWLKLGNETKVEHDYFGYSRIRKTYPLTKDLWEVVGDRIMDENGFADKKEAYKAWREIATAIMNVQPFSPETTKAVEDSRKVEENCRKDTSKRMIEEWICAGYTIKERKNPWTDTVTKELETIYLRPETNKGGLGVHAKTSQDGTKGTWEISYKGTSFKIPEGHLQEGLAKIRNFFRDWEDWTEGLKNN